jgi:hypothetical protein
MLIVHAANVLLAQGALTGSGASLLIAIVSGCAAVTAAGLGILGTRAPRRRNNAPPSNGNNDKIVGELIDDLRKRNEGLLESVSKRDNEIDRLRQICWQCGINPQTGLRVRSNSEQHPD